MSDYKETEHEKEIRKLSMDKNPYAPECPNRNLWSEGFRMGVKHALSEHSTKEQEVVAYLVNFGDSMVNNYYNASYLNATRRERMIKEGYTVTPLIKQPNKWDGFKPEDMGDKLTKY